MGAQLAQAGLQAGGSLLGGIFGLALEGHNDKRQLRQQQALTDMELAANKNMASYQQGLQYDMWQKTNYPAQVEQLQKAGLNPGLLYGMSGGGGATTGGTGGGIGGGKAPAGGGEIMGMMNMKMQMAMTEANVELAKSQANKNNVEAQKIGGIDTGVAAQTLEKLKAETRTESEKTILTKTQNEIAELDVKLKDGTLESNIQSANNLAEKLNQDYQAAIKQNQITEATRDLIPKLMKAEIALKVIQTEMTREQKKFVGPLAESTIRTNATNRVTAQENVMTALMNATTAKDKQNWDQWINDISRSTGLPTQTIENILKAVMIVK